MANRQEDIKTSDWINFKIMESEHLNGIFIKTSILVITIGLLLIMKKLISCSSKPVYKQLNPVPTPRISKIVFYFMTLKNFNCSSSKSTPPICVAQQFAIAMCKIFESWRIFQLYLGFKPVVFFFKPETVKVVLSSSSLTDKATEYDMFQIFLKTGLLTSSGKKWRQRRKLLNPAFHISILTDFVPIFYEKSKNLVAKLHTLTEEPWVNIGPLISACALDILCQTAMEVDMDSKVEGYAEFSESISNLFELCFKRMLRPWLYLDIIFKLHPMGRRTMELLRNFHGFTREVMKQKKARMLEQRQLNSKVGDASTSQTKKRRVLLDLLLEHHLNDPSFTEDDIAEEVDTFMVAGQDTTAASLSWSIYLLGLDERVQEKVHDELEDILQGDIDREITLEDLNRMQYLECVIKETLRIYSPPAFVARNATESFQVLNYTVQKGSTLFILPYVLHHDPENFPEPERYLPERFLPENSVERHPYSYMPFLIGPRNCIGKKYAMLQMKMVLANVLRSFHVASLDHRDKIAIQPLPVLKSIGPLRVRFKRRK